MTQFWKVIDVILLAIVKEKDLYEILLKLTTRDEELIRVVIVG